jgi:hypothetical protein
VSKSSVVRLDDFDRFLEGANNSNSFYARLGYFFIPAEIPKEVSFKRVVIGGISPRYIYGSESWISEGEYDPPEFSIVWYPSSVSGAGGLEEFVKGGYAPCDERCSSWQVLCA